MNHYDLPDIIAGISEKPQSDFNELLNIWNSATKKMILVGSNYPNEALQECVHQFAMNDSVIVLTETTSNLEVENVINSIDKVIFPMSIDTFETFKPDVLITLGGMVVSKKIKQFLRKCQPQHHWQVY